MTCSKLEVRCQVVNMSSEEIIATSPTSLSEKRKNADDNSETIHVNKKSNLEVQNENMSTERPLEPVPLETDVKSGDTVEELSAKVQYDVQKTETDQTECNTDSKPILFNGKDINSLSKSQMKKYKKMLSWEATKKDKRKKEKLRAKERRIEAKKNNIDIGPSRKQLKLSKMSLSSCKTSVIIDLSFDDLMIPKDIGKVIKQILRVYTENRRSKTPMQLHLCSFNGKSKEEMAKHSGHENWDCHFHEEKYIDLFPKEKLVYLSSESDNIIKELEEDKMYIIGGLVDHNAHKGICFDKAVKQGISHGQLPLGEFFECKRRKVFTINQVFEILLRVSEGLMFKEAFEKVLPARLNIVPTLE